MLLAWSMIYKHNFSPHRFYIWNNKHILFKNKSLFLKQWFESNIVLVSQLFNQDGRLYSYSEFLTTFGIPVTPKDFSVVFDAIPTGVILFRGVIGNDNPPVLGNVLETHIGKSCLSVQSKSVNKNIRRFFQQEIITVPSSVPYWSNFVGDMCWNKVWLLPHKFFFN